MAIQSMNIASRCLGTNTNVTVILPNPPMGRSLKDFYTSGEKYKVLWLLHGGGGDATEWVRYSNIERYACDRNLVVVMPSAMGSAYSNWSAKEGCFIGFNMYDYLTEALMPLVYNWFPQVSDRREDNFISGFSMGGVTTWYAFMRALDLFRWFLPLSGDCWLYGRLGGFSHAEETARALAGAVAKQGFTPDDFRVHAITGTKDIAYPNETAQIDAMRAWPEVFRFGDNIDYDLLEGGVHDYANIHRYIYNALPAFFAGA